ncbi:MAG: hypothetical protein JO297_12410 [Nitrososphaeraceae archaeon]|nr:hypothetical protein [Nitrososphaeraceae archaeon]
MDTTISYLLVGLGYSIGIILHNAIPFMQRQLARQQLYETLSWKPEKELTDADKFFLQKMREPFKFGISYVYSALAGLGISLVTTLGSMSALISASKGISDPASLVLTSLMSAMGGNWLSNQLIKSENVATLSTPTGTTSSVSGIIGTIKDKIVKTSSETISDTATTNKNSTTTPDKK